MFYTMTWRGRGGGWAEKTTVSCDKTLIFFIAIFFEFD